MEINILYKNGSTDVITTDSLTQADCISNHSDGSIMTKFRINWAEFVSQETPSHLNLYIYYYRKSSNKNSCITNPKYLDKVMFYNNDQLAETMLNSQQIKQKGKSLPYGSLEPGSWYTLIPLELKDDIQEVTLDEQLMLYKHQITGELLNLSNFYYYEKFYCPDADMSASIEERIEILYDSIRQYIKENSQHMMSLDEVVNNINI